MVFSHQRTLFFSKKNIAHKSFDKKHFDKKNVKKTKFMILTKVRTQLQHRTPNFDINSTSIRHQFDTNSTPYANTSTPIRHQFDTNSTPIRQCTVYQMGRTIYQIGVRSINSAYALSNRRTQRQRTIT